MKNTNESTNENKNENSITPLPISKNFFVLTREFSTEKKLIKRVLHACLREQLLNYKLIDDLLVVSLPKNKKTLVVQNVQKLSLGKLKIKGDIILMSESQCTVLTKVRQLLKIVFTEIKETVDAAQWKPFVKEIQNCALNETLVAPFVKQARDVLNQNILNTKHKNLIDYVTANFSVAEQLIFFEFWASSGHPYHPCHKTKLGFNSEDYLKYSPEFNPDVNLPVAAIDKSLVQMTSGEDSFHYQEWFAKEFPQQWNDWKAKLESKQMTIADYHPFFVHPWQYENVFTKLFKKHIANGRLQIFEDSTIQVKPSLSFRTLIVKDGGQKPHIKLPVAIYSTSAMRTITPSSVHNGPSLARIFREICAAENDFQNRIKFAHEICGLHLHSYSTKIAKNLGIIYRQNPSKLLEKKEVPIVVAALFEKSPVNGMPLFVELIHSAVGDQLNKAMEYFDDYCKIVLPPHFDLFLIYGIALEGHQQNTIAVFENYRPKYMISRDLGGVRIHTPTLKSMGYHFDAHPESTIIFEDREPVASKFSHTVLQYHLGELVSLLAEYYQVPEDVFWKVVKNNLKTRFENLKNRVPEHRWKDEYHSLLVADWHIKGLMCMRFKNDAYNDVSIDVPNPLRDL